MSVVRPGTSSDVRQAYLRIVVLQNDRDNSTMGMRPHANHEHNKQYNHNNPTGSKATLCTSPSTLQPAIVPKVDPPTTMGLTLGNTNDSPILDALAYAYGIYGYKASIYHAPFCYSISYLHQKYKK